MKKDTHRIMVPLMGADYKALLASAKANGRCVGREASVIINGALLRDAIRRQKAEARKQAKGA